MKDKAIWRIRVAVTPESEDAVNCLMESVLGMPASIYTDVQKGRSWSTVYLPKLSLWSRAHQSRLLAGLREISRMGLALPRVHVSASRLANEDWAESWKRHFKPLEIGPGLLVLPSWSKRKPKLGQTVLTLDPGLSFGTGQHPTTHFCLEELLGARVRRKASSLLDMGCGSGILAIAAAKLGYERVDAFDFDPASVRVAGENATANGVRDRLRLTRQDLTRLPLKSSRQYDVVCANLTSNLLVAEAERIRRRVAGDGRLVLAGILITQFPEVQRAYEKQGLELLRTRRKKEWQSGAFAFRKAG